jgi:hypothetical protein
MMDLTDEDIEMMRKARDNAMRAAGRSAPACPPRCEGFRRHGGAFSLGPVTWEQCCETATVLLTVTQDGETQTLPACPTCWEEARNTKGITVTDAKPIAARPRSIGAEEVLEFVHGYVD